jgi:hypothetical protein
MKLGDLAEMLCQDPEFVHNYSQYHPEVENELDSVVFDIWGKIKDLRIYEKEYGYFAIDDKTDVINWVVGFFVLPDFRKKNTLIEDIKKETNSLFMVAISNTNKRAMRFLEKNCTIMKQDMEKTIFYCKRGN